VLVCFRLGYVEMCCVVLGHVNFGCVGFVNHRLLWVLLIYVALGLIC